MQAYDSDTSGGTVTIRAPAPIAKKEHFVLVMGKRRNGEEAQEAGGQWVKFGFWKLGA